MTKEDLKDALGEALEEKFGKFFVSPEQHAADHRLVGGIRKGVRWSAVKTMQASLWSLGLAIMGAIVYGIKQFLSQVMK